MNDKIASVSFLRGVPADEAMERLVPMAANGYAEVIDRHGAAVLQYGHFLGFGPLREILAASHGVAPGRVVAGNGGMEMISLFFKALPLKSTILIEEATYDRVITDALRYGHRLIGVPLGTEGLDLERFEALAAGSKAAAFYGIPFHHNPTGITYTEENRLAVEGICRARGLFCIWDICYEALRYDGTANLPIAVDAWGPVLMSSFTKTISPGTKHGGPQYGSGHPFSRRCRCPGDRRILHRPDPGRNRRGRRGPVHRPEQGGRGGHCGCLAGGGPGL